MRLWLLCVLLLLLAPGVARAGDVAAFYYPWYGTRSTDGSFQHWSQRNHHPPQTIASNYWPARGIYSSSSKAVLDSQMSEMEQAGIGEVIVSWWGRGSAEDRRLPTVAAAARAHGLKVAIHLEPYTGRTVASTIVDVAYLRTFGITDFYLYRPFDVPPASWATLNGALPHDVRVFAQTALVGKAEVGRFAGVYTYDVFTYRAPSLHRICHEAHAAGLLCAPSVGPGFDARAATGSTKFEPRRDGRTYDAMWSSAIDAGADLITITSFNEWHEGTQIEPAADRRGYKTYDGAWGLSGKAAEDAYLSRTAYWAARYRAVAP